MADDLYAPPGTEQFDWPPRQGSALGIPPRTSGIESALGRRQAQRDLYDPTQFQPADGGQALTGTPVHQPGMLGDFGRQVLASTMQMGEGLLGAVSAANVALGGDPEMRAIVDKGRHAVADATRSVIETMSPKAQAAMQASLFGGTDRHGNETPGPGTVGWGSYIGATIASAIPTVVLAVIPGTVIGSAVGGMAATGTLFGAIQSGEAYNAFVDALDKATPQQLEQSEVYRELIGRGMSDTDARKEMLKTITPGLAAMQFGIGAATGVGYAHMFGKGLAGSALSRMGVGAAEGAALGALQGAGGNLASQRAEIQAGILGDYNLGDAAATGAAGALGGIILGGGAGALAGRRRPSALKGPPGRPVDVPADQAAALSEAGPIAPPRAPVQGEMFLPHEMGAGPRPGEAAGMPTQQPDLFGGPTVQVTERAPAFEHQGVRMTGDPSTAPMPPPQREMLPGAPEQRVPAPPDAVPPELRQPPPEVPGQLDLPLQPREPMQAAQPAVPPVAAEPPPTPARAPRKRATQGEPTAAQPQEQGVSPTPAAPAAPAAPAPATRRPSVAPEQGAPAPKATTVVEPAPSAPPAKPEPPATKADIKEAVQGPVVEKVAGAKVAEAPLAPEPAKPQTLGDKLRARRAAEKARMAATGERQRGVVASVGEDKPDTPAPPAAPAFDREAARAAVAKEIVPLKNGADTTRAMNRMLDEIEGIMALRTKRGEPDLQGALREWVRSQPDRLPGTKSRPGELADRILRKVEGRSLTDTAENRAAARQEVRQPNVAENERVARKAASEEATSDNVAADDYAVTKESFADSEAAARGETPEEAAIREATPEESSSSGVTVYRPELARERVSTKDTERVAADLLHDVLQGTKTSDEAAIAYGGPAETGRKRKNAEFADYVEKQVAHYGKEATRSRLADELMQAEQARAKASGSTRDRQEASLKVDRLRREYDLTSADNLDAMRAMIHDLRHPEIREALEAERARKKAAKQALADEAKEVGVPASVMQKLRQMVSTAERQADVKAMLAVEDHTRRNSFSLTDLAKQMGYDPRAWLEEHQHRMLGKGEPNAERARMYDAVFEEANARQAAADGEREKIARSYGSDMARVEKAQERLDVPDQHLARAYQWLAENYGDARISRNLASLVASVDDAELSRPINDLLRPSSQRLGIHTLLDRIASDARMQEQAPWLARLAKLLRKKTPDLDVISIDEAATRFQLTTKDMELLDTATGAYIWKAQGGGAIMLQRDPASHITAVHEAVHAATQHFINKNPRDPEVLALERIRQELRTMKWSILHANSKGGKLGRVDYAMYDTHETLAMMMTDPTVQGFMAKTKASGQLIEDMRALGIDPTVGRPSLWNVFVDWIKKIVGIDPHKDGVTMLDYAMRVGLRTIRAADEWNAITPEVWKGRGDTAVAANRISPNIRTPEDPAGREMLASARGAVNRVVSAADLPGMGDKARAAVLQAATTDSIVEWNRKLAEPSARLGVKGNPLVRLRDALEDITGVARRYHEQHADTVGELADRLRSKAGQDVAQLMNDATLAEVRLGTRDTEANAHLTTPEQQDALREIQGRYDAISDEAKKLYQDTRAYYETTYRAERKERLDALIDAVMPEATEDQRTAILKALRTRAGTEALLTKGDPHVEAAFGNDWTAHRALVRGVAQVHKMGFVRGDYFPLRRYGDYVLRYGSGEEGNYGVEMFERRGEAEARRAELAAQGVADLSQVMDRRESQLRDLLPNSPIADEIERAVAKNPALRGHAEAVRDVVNQVLLEHATRSERVRTQFRRKGVAGAAVDPSRVLASEYLASGYRMGHIKHGFDRARALSDLQLVVDDLGRHGGSGEQIRLSQVKKEMEQRLATGDDAQSFFSGFARRATTLGYIQSLMSPSHMVTNTIGVWNNAVPMIGARHGAVAASAQLARASAQVAPKVLGQGARNFFNALGKGLKAADWRMSHLARDRLIAAGANKEHMTRLFEALDHVGLIDHTQDRELQNIANANRVSTTGVGKLWQRFMDLNAAGAHAVDVMNKSAVAKAAFDLEFRKTGDVQGAIDYAMETLRKAHPNYNLSNRSRISTNKGSLGQFGAPIMQFKAYGLHMYGVLANLTKQSMHGASTAERREARLALAGIIATHAATAGIVNTIADPLRYIGGAWDWITGAPRPRDYQSDVRNFIADIFGPELGEVISRGLPRLAGIDLSNRVGLGNMLTVPELESFDSKGMVKMVGLALMGASGQDAAEIGAGVAKMFQGDVAGGAQQALPRVFRDAMKAYRLSDKGATGPRSQVIIPAEQLSMADILAQASGFQPAKVAEAREARQATSSRMMEARDTRTRLATKWLEADPADRSALMGDIRDYNQKNPGFTLTVAQLLQMQKDRGKAAKQDFGLRVPPKAGYLRQDARFANVER